MLNKICQHAEYVVALICHISKENIIYIRLYFVSIRIYRRKIIIKLVMTFLKLKWLRRFVRKNTNPIEYAKAVFWKEKLSLGYMLLAWNAFGLVCYMVYSGRADWAQYYGVKSAEDMRLSPGKVSALVQMCTNEMKLLNYSFQLNSSLGILKLKKPR